MADDSNSQTVLDNQTSTSLPEDTSSPPQTPVAQASSDSASGDQSTGSDTNRPVSTIPADSVLTPSPEPTQSQDTSSPIVQDIPVQPPVAAEEQVTIPVDQSILEKPSVPVDSQTQPQPSESAADIPVPQPDQSADIGNRLVSTIPAETSVKEGSSQTPPPEQSAISESPIIPEATQSAGLQQSDSALPVQSDQPVSEDSSDTNRPVSTIPADSKQSPSSDQSADSKSRPEPAISTDSPDETTKPADSSNTSSLSPSISPSTVSDSTDSSLPIPSGSSTPSIPAQTADSGVQNDTDGYTGMNPSQFNQVQSGAPDDAYSNTSENPKNQSAGIQAEPPQPIQTAPIPPPKIQNSWDSLSFGDILAGKTSEELAHPAADSQPEEDSEPSQAPSVTFGDLIKDIDYSAQTVPEAIRPAEQTTQSSVSPLPTPVSASAGQSDQSVQLDQKLKDELSLRRQKANQVRSQKKAKHLDKIMELAKNTKSISNTDVQRLLHVSQSTATNYLAELARKGLLKRQGTRGGAKYTL